MPILDKFRETHYVNTSKVSDNVRALSLSAIGIVWIFKKQVGDNYQIPYDLYIPVLLIFFAMAIDFLQYLYGSVAWFIFFRGKEKDNVNETDDITAPPAINWPSYFLFYSKVLAMAFAYYYLCAFLISRIKLT